MAPFLLRRQRRCAGWRNLNRQVLSFDLVRLTREHILRLLDIGVEGLVMAHMETPKDARNIVDLSKYYPIGKRGFSPYTRAGKYSGGDITEHAHRQNEKTLV